MLRKFFLAATVALAAVLCPAQNTDTSLESIVETVSAECPMAINDHSSIDAVKLTDKAVEFYLAMPIPDSQFLMLQQNMNMLRPTLLQMFSSDTGMRDIISKASARGLGLTLVIICKDDRQKSFTIAYEASELADALK